ncbi:ROK family protein [Aliiglaciecola litoralis]|uniref:fructokinase n=1 Tax=Aliiglaciecola litoralis TaxID=582857 RepID=A0ABN1LD12_9ALTE
MKAYYAAIEAGGTKFNCAIVDAARNIIVEHRVATTTPQETLAQTVDFFKKQRAAGYDFDALGLACFGPVDLRKSSATFGYITKTPKPHWSNTPVVAILAEALDCRIEFDTDVNAAAIAESRWGAAKDTEVSNYVTVGTGVGVGIVVNGKSLKGLIHPELGHMLIPAPEGIQGQCPFHGNCVEGLASGRAMSQIWGVPAETLDDDHQAWDIQAKVLSKLCHNLLVSFSPEKIVMGGGVMAKPGLLDKVLRYTEDSLAGYLVLPDDLSLEHIICLPGLGSHSGLMGALALVLDEPV